MRINNKKINKLILVIVLFVLTITINSSVMAKVYTYQEVNNMNVADLRDIDIQETIEKLEEDYESNVRSESYRNALDNLKEERKLRQNNGTWNPNKTGSFDYKEYEPGKTGDSTKVQTIAGNVLRIVRNIGVVLAILALTIIGFKYMVGSVEQKAEYKKSMIPFVIGVIILASSTTFVSIIYDITTNTFKEKETFDEKVQTGEDAARQFLSIGPTKQQLYSEVASASKKKGQDIYYLGYFNTLLNSMPSKFKEGYNSCQEALKHNPSGVEQWTELYRGKYSKATNTSDKEYYAGYLLAIGDTYCLIELTR